MGGESVLVRSNSAIVRVLREAVCQPSDGGSGAYVCHRRGGAV